MSSKRAIIDSQVKKDMPHLEFNGVFKNLHQDWIMQPHEMQWSSHEFNKPKTIETMMVL